MMYRLILIKLIEQIQTKFHKIGEVKLYCTHNYYDF